MSRALPSVRAGDALGIVAPAGPVDRERLQRGMRVLTDWGLEPRLAQHAQDRSGLFAANDADRAADLAAAFADRGQRAVLYARGGYGTTRLLPRLDLAKVRRSGKLLAGYSDITALGLALSRESPFPYLYAPNVDDLAGQPPVFDAASYRAGLFGQHPGGRQEVGGLTSLRGGKADGIVLGGCLSLIVTLVGTPFEASFDGRVLFLEEVNEEPYRIDRMLTHLATAGRLDGLAGLLVGQLVSCDRGTGVDGPTAEDVMASFADRIDGPVLLGLPAGHGPDRQTIPLGVRVEVDGAAGTVIFHHETD